MYVCISIQRLPPSRGGRPGHQQNIYLGKKCVKKTKMCECWKKKKEEKKLGKIWLGNLFIYVIYDLILFIILIENGKFRFIYY
jgi:hypothetical protein